MSHSLHLPDGFLSLLDLLRQEGGAPPRPLHLRNPQSWCTIDETWVSSIGTGQFLSVRHLRLHYGPIWYHTLSMALGPAPEWITHFQDTFTFTLSLKPHTHTTIPATNSNLNYQESGKTTLCERHGAWWGRV